MNVCVKTLVAHCKLLCELQIHFCLINLQGALLEKECCDDGEFSSRLLHTSGRELGRALLAVTESREPYVFATAGGVTEFVRLVPFCEGSRILGVIAVGVNSLGEGEDKPRVNSLTGARVERRTLQLLDTLKHLETEMGARQNAEAEQRRLGAQMLKVKRLETMGSLAGGIAHEFNNMLTVILGNLGLVQMQISKSSPVSGALENLETATLQAAQLTNQLLSFSGRGRVSTTMVSLSKMVTELAPLLRISATGECELAIEPMAKLPKFLGDVGQLQEVLVGLVTNARAAYGQAGGKISINTGLVAMKDSDFLNCHVDYGFEAGDWVYMEVVDYGSGISDNVKKHMFDPFFSTSTDHTGLGLSACLGIVRSHGGAMSVDSKEGEGTTVRVLFPVTIEASDEDPVGPMVLLVVDNDPAVLEITTNLLHSLDHEVLSVGSGHEAVELFSNRHGDIDGVLLDKTMPGMSGLDCFSLLKEISPQVPVVIMTGFDESSVENDFGVNAVESILPKPFQVSDLVQALSSIRSSLSKASQTV